MTVPTNLEAICKAMDQHDRNCGRDLIEIRMNPHEVERLGWDEIRGVPIVEDGELGTGMFRLICEADELPRDELEVSQKEPLVTA